MLVGDRCSCAGRATQTCMVPYRKNGSKERKREQTSGFIRIGACVSSVPYGCNRTTNFRMGGLWGSGTSLELYLKEEGLKTLLFSGVNTDQVQSFHSHRNAHSNRSFSASLGQWSMRISTATTLLWSRTPLRQRLPKEAFQMCCTTVKACVVSYSLPDNLMLICRFLS